MKARKHLQQKSSEFHKFDLYYSSPAELGELRSRHNAVYRQWSYHGKLKVGEHVDINHCLPNRMNFMFINRNSPEAATLPPSFAKIPPLAVEDAGTRKDYVKEVKEIMYMLRPELKPTVKTKTNLSGRTPVTSVAGRSPDSRDVDDEGIMFFAQEVLRKSKSENLVAAFKVLDTNKSGGLSQSEFELGLKSLDIVMDKDESRRIFKWLDMDRQGSITLNEWTRLDVVINMLHRSGRFKEDSMKKIATQRRPAIVDFEHVFQP